jgi:hypothetical protein
MQTVSNQKGHKASVNPGQIFNAINSTAYNRTAEERGVYHEPQTIEPSDSVEKSKESEDKTT